MFIDSRSIDSAKIIDTDVCIVGAGVAGLTMAMEFRQAKFNTCIIESGGEKADKATQALYWGENIGIPYYPLDTARARLLGGSSHYWGVRLVGKGLGVRLRPLDPIDFEAREWVPYSGWPFNKARLDPYYERAQTVCRIGPYRYDTRAWTDPEGPQPLPFHGGGVETVMFQFGVRDVFFREYAGQVGKAGNITTLLHGNAIDIETNETATEVNRIHVACLNGNRFSVSAKIFVLAMGGLEVPRLLLLSDKVQKTGLGNANDLVGRFFMEHPHLWLSAYFPASVDIANSTGLYDVFEKNGTNVMGKIAITENALREEKLLNWVASLNLDYQLSHNYYLGYYKKGVTAARMIKYAVKQRRGLSAVTPHLADALAGMGDNLSYLYRKMRNHAKRDFDRAKHVTVYRLNPMVEQAPNPESRVVLGAEKDALGQRRINLDWQLTPLDTYTITRAQELLDDALRGAGLGHLLIETKRDEIPRGIHGGWHHMGTTRMHSDPKQGVIDPDCRVHGIANLYVAGASAFPTSGYANPVLTTIALVLRLADHIRHRMRT
jgi:choline dehydrogenase-like flavoprotein